jgi:ribosome maturation factor RimP
VTQGTWHDQVKTTVEGMGFDLVEVERLASGLLRITIDMPWVEGQPESWVTVEDCEAVTRQLQFLFEVEGVDYKRLEVGSPGVDRLLRHEQDLQRFAGEQVEVTLKSPIGAAAGLGSGVSGLRKKFKGTLEARAEGGWQVLWTDAPQPKPGVRVSKKAKPVEWQALAFEWSEVREARLAPVLDFKGRQPKNSGSTPQ